MSVLHATWGGEFSEQGMDNVQMVEGTYTPIGTVPGGQSLSLTSTSTQIKSGFIPFYKGQITGPAFSFGLKLRPNNNDEADGRYKGINYSGGTGGIGVLFRNFTHQLRVGSISYDTGIGFTNNEWYTYVITVSNGIQVGSVVNLYVNRFPVGTPDATRTLDASDVSVLGGLPDRFYFLKSGNFSTYLDDMWILDDSAGGTLSASLMAAGSMQRRVLTGEGTYQDQISGVYTDINDVPSDTNAVVLSTTNDAYSATFEAVQHSLVYGVTIAARIVSDGSAGANLEVGLTDGVNEVFETVPAPIDGYINVFLTQAPSGGGPVDLTGSPSLLTGVQAFIRTVT